MGAVGKVSDCQPEGPGFKLRVELWAIFFRHTVRGQGRQAIGLVSISSINSHTCRYEYNNSGVVDCHFLSYKGSQA